MLYGVKLEVIFGKEGFSVKLEVILGKEGVSFHILYVLKIWQNGKGNLSVGGGRGTNHVKKSERYLLMVP